MIISVCDAGMDYQHVALPDADRLGFGATAVAMQFTLLDQVDSAPPDNDGDFRTLVVVKPECRMFSARRELYINRQPLRRNMLFQKPMIFAFHRSFFHLNPGKV